MPASTAVVFKMSRKLAVPSKISSSTRNSARKLVPVSRPSSTTPAMDHFSLPFIRKTLGFMPSRPLSGCIGCSGRRCSPPRLWRSRDCFGAFPQSAPRRWRRPFPPPLPGHSPGRCPGGGPRWSPFSPGTGSQWPGRSPPGSPGRRRRWPRPKSGWGRFSKWHGQCRCAASARRKTGCRSRPPSSHIRRAGT